MHRILCWTILILCIPIYELVAPTPLECGFIYLILQTVFLSILFWWNPVRDSWMHRVDAWNAKFVIAVGVIYTLGFKELPIYDQIIYLALCAILAWTFYQSDRHSISWCSHLHLIYHAFLHFVGGLMTILTLSAQ